MFDEDDSLSQSSSSSSDGSKASEGAKSNDSSILNFDDDIVVPNEGEENGVVDEEAATTVEHHGAFLDPDPSLNLTPEEIALDREMKISCIIRMQALARRYFSRCKVVRFINKRFEKIWDPKTDKYYYYDTKLDKSSWTKPSILLDAEIDDIAPTYLDEPAALMVQRQYRRLVALRKVQKLYKEVISEISDETTETKYYFNPRLFTTHWDLPAFMQGEYDHEPKWEAKRLALEKARKEMLAKKKFEMALTGKKDTSGSGESDGGSDTDSGSITPDDESSVVSEGADSNASEDTQIMIEKRRAQRKYPRSKAQSIVDAVEDDETVVEVNLSHLNASHVTSRIYDFSYIKRLLLNHNRLKRLSTEIQHLTELELLDISFNLIETFPVEIEELTKLVCLRASNNRLIDLPGQFYKLAELEILDFGHNEFESLPIISGNLELLKELKEWDVGIGCLTKIRHLDVSYNKLTAWPLQLEKLVLMGRLFLSHNQIPVMNAECLLGFKHLTVLDMSYNLVEEFPSCLYDLPLQRLLLNNNCIPEFGPCEHVSDHLMKNLVELNISYNKFTVFDHRIGLFNKLLTFNASHNKIESIHEAVGIMTQVSNINLSHNQLTDLPATMRSMRALHTLDLSYNEMEHLPVVLSMIANITYLDISHNKLLDLNPKVFALTTKLKTLYLQYNAFREIPPTLFGHTKLVDINLSHNKIEEISDGFGSLLSCKFLYLNNNCIYKISPYISAMEKLEILTLHHNSIFELPQDLSGMKSIRKLTLAHNSLPDIPPVLFTLNTLLNWDCSWNRIPLSKLVNIADIPSNFRPVKMKKGSKKPGKEHEKVSALVKFNSVLSNYLQDKSRGRPRFKVFDDVLNAILGITNIIDHDQENSSREGNGGLERGIREQLILEGIQDPALPQRKGAKKMNKFALEALQVQRDKRIVEIRAEQFARILDWHDKLQAFVDYYSFELLNKITDGDNSQRMVRRKQLWYHYNEYSESHPDVIDGRGRADTNTKNPDVLLFDNNAMISSKVNKAFERFDDSAAARGRSATKDSIENVASSKKDPVSEALQHPDLLERARVTKMLHVFMHRVRNDSYNGNVMDLVYSDVTASDLVKISNNSKSPPMTISDVLKVIQLDSKQMLMMQAMEKVCHDIAVLSHIGNLSAEKLVDRDIINGIKRDLEKAKAASVKLRTASMDGGVNQKAGKTLGDSSESHNKSFLGGMFSTKSRKRKVTIDDDAKDFSGSERPRTESNISLMESEASISPRNLPGSVSSVSRLRLDSRGSDKDSRGSQSSVKAPGGVMKAMFSKRVVVEDIERESPGADVQKSVKKKTGWFSSIKRGSMNSFDDKENQTTSKVNGSTPTDEQLLEAAVGNLAFDDADDMDKYKMSDYGALPLLLTPHRLKDEHDKSLVDSYNILRSRLFNMAFEAYMQYASILLKQVGLYTATIRDIEKSFAISRSVIPISQRIGADLEEFAADEFEEMKKLIAAKDDSVGATLRAKKQKKLAQQKALLAKAQELAGTVSEKESKAETSEREAAAQEGPSGIDQCLDYTVLIPSLEAAKTIISYLNTQRHRAMLYAFMLVEHLTLLLRLQGWDPTCKAFADGAKRGGHGLHGPVTTVDAVAKSGKANCIRITLYRAEVLSFWGLFDSAISEYNRVKALVPRMKYIYVQSIKCNLALGNYADADSLFKNLLLREVPKEVLRKGVEQAEDMSLGDMFTFDNELGFLKMIIKVCVGHLYRGGYDTAMHRRVYKLETNGALSLHAGGTPDVKNPRRYTENDAVISYHKVFKKATTKLEIDKVAESQFLVEERDARRDISARVEKIINKVKRTTELNELALNPPPPVVEEEVKEEEKIPLDSKGRPFPPGPEVAKKILDDAAAAAAKAAAAAEKALNNAGRGGRGRGRGGFRGGAGSKTVGRGGRAAGRVSGRGTRKQ